MVPFASTCIGKCCGTEGAVLRNYVYRLKGRGGSVASIKLDGLTAFVVDHSEGYFHQQEKTSFETQENGGTKWKERF